jgi:DNA-binding response OmpR family regulator
MGSNNIQTPSPGRRRHRLLIADHDHELRAGLAAMLNAAGYDVLHAADGKSALEIQAQTPAEVVIVEMLLPKLDGFEIMVHLSREVARPKFVAMTSGGKLGPDFYLRTALQLGAHGTLAKPFEHKRLLGMVHRILQGEPPEPFTTPPARGRK